ncbi:hypothetical protein C0991_009499 [Blastosporella zonata]|nr:hypothetical protein C0991_009499 [Blastosporella zonata]
MAEKNALGEKVITAQSEKNTLTPAASITTPFHGEPDGSSIIDGSEGVTEHEFATLRHVADRLPYTAWLVVVVEFAERWSYYGTTNIFNNYIQFPLPPGSTNGAVPPALRGGDDVAGALGQGQQKAFALRTFNTFWIYCTPWVGGIIADVLWGRYKTIMVFSLLCKTAMYLSVFLLSLSLLWASVLGKCIKANVSPMIAEQYTGKLRKETLPSGEVVIKSPAVTIQSVYLWFYAAINFGSAGAISASFLARDNGYWAAFLVPTCIFALVPIVLLIGKNHYITTPPRGSILLETFRVIGYAMGPRWSLNPFKTYCNAKADGFWDPAKPSYYAEGQVPEKMTWDDEFVGEVGRTISACKVFLFFPVFWLCYSQIDGNLGTVAAGMTLNGTPNDLIQNLNPISIIVMIPIFDYFVYPFLRRRGINFTPIKRIYAGFLVAGLAMTYASVLQSYINKTSPCRGGEFDKQPAACSIDGVHSPSPLNVWIVSGPYILVGMAEIFASITSLEYAFTKAPKRMKSVVMAFSQFQTALSSALNFTLTAVNVENKFVWLFASFAITAWITGTVFFFTFRNLDRQEAELNAIGQGQRTGFVDESPQATIEGERA